jgi:hypothetical protein
MSLTSFQLNLLKKYKLVIYDIDPNYSTDYIIEVLYIQHIAKVSRIILVPYISPYDGEMYNVAYVDLYEWNNNEYAQEFIKMLESPLPYGKEVYLYHYNNLGWPVRLITNTDMVFNLGYPKIVAIYYSLKYYNDKNEDWDNDSETMALVRSEFIAKQCAENILDCE